MRILIAEDDFTSRRMLQSMLTPYGECDIAVDGDEAITAFRLAWEESYPYDLICMDIMMPNIDGQTALQKIREIEREIAVNGHKEVKVVMTTALGDARNVMEAFYKGGATSYLVKPVTRQTLTKQLRSLGLIRKTTT
jgi:two-component system, chemotaxis family, chemotaxis protein CheY